jgi:carboxyl-terminal processing protease
MQLQKIRKVFAAFFCHILIVSCVYGQETKHLSLRDDASSFNMSRGSSFSASGPVKADKGNFRPSPIALIANDFDDALRIIQRNYVSPSTVTSDSVFSGAVNRMLGELDPHSSYYTRSEFKELNDKNHGRYFGTGMSISNFVQNGSAGTYVISITKASPADRAGIRFGDRIVSVDKFDVGDNNSEIVRDLIRGPEGTFVSVVYVRSGEGSLRTVRLRRTILPENTIPVAMIYDQGVGYIALTDGFHYTTFSEFTSALTRLKAVGMRSLIVDLRGNGGGILEQAIRIAEQFLPAGRMIVSQRGRYSAEDHVWRSTNKAPETLPLVLLVDENTASASEVFAAAMQDNDRALIVGTKTFGKGLVQDVIPLEDGSGLVLTSERYYAPSGRSLQREYSDSGRYDYFRHVSSGTLIDRPESATKTLRGRVVYGGDGIRPDTEVPTKSWSKTDLSDYQRAFFIAREGQVEPSMKDDPNVVRHVKWFQATALSDSQAATRISLESDPQFQAALAGSISNRPKQNK